LPALAALLGPKSEADVDQASNELLKAAGLTPTGRRGLRDGRSGEYFSSDVTVGSIYMMKLSHWWTTRLRPLHRAVLAGDAAAARR